MTNEKYTKAFQKAVNDYTKLRFNQDECNRFMDGFHKGAEAQQLSIADVIELFSGDKLQMLQKHFVDLYGSDEMAREKANSFAVGFEKACELIIKELNTLSR